MQHICVYSIQGRFFNRPFFRAINQSMPSQSASPNDASILAVVKATFLRHFAMSNAYLFYHATYGSKDRLTAHPRSKFGRPE